MYTYYNREVTNGGFYLKLVNKNAIIQLVLVPVMLQVVVDLFNSLANYTSTNEGSILYIHAVNYSQ